MPLQRRAVARTRSPRRNNGERNRRQHEYDRRDRRRLGEQCRRTSRPERGLGTHAAKRPREIGRLAALQKDHNDEKQAHNYVHDC